MAQQPQTAQRPAQTQVMGGVDRPKTSAGAKVTVACNIPNGIRIRAYRMVPDREPVLGGGVRDTTRAEPVSESILIRGTAHEIDKAPRAPIVAGYALTSGVDKDIWNNWYEANKDSHLVKNRCVFAYEDRDDTVAAAKENEGTKSGLEPFNPDKDERAPRSRSNIAPPRPEDEQRERRAREEATLSTME